MTRIKFSLAALVVAISLVVAGCGDLVPDQKSDAESQPVADAGGSKDAAPSADVGAPSSDVAAVKCITSEDCDDGNPCSRPALCHTACEGCQGTCELKQLAFPTGNCSDSNACTEGDKCKSGQCVAGAPKKCDDNNACTADTCDPAKGCVVTQLQGAVCDDNNACTKGDSCKDGVCGTSALANSQCNDDNPCTTDACDKAKGCSNTPNANPCNDNNACTSGDKCGETGLCGSGKPVDCDDKSVCTTDACDPSKGCVNAPTGGGACDDNNSGTENDQCVASGKCEGTPLKCTTDADCILVVKDVCINAVCVGKQCMTDKSSLKNQVSDNNDCTDDACDPKTGAITHMPVKTVKLCDDGEVCTVSDACSSGTCKGTPQVCDDGNACTDDFCESKVGCKSSPTDAKKWDDGKWFTKDWCAPAVGKVNSPITVGASVSQPADMNDQYTPVAVVIALKPSGDSAVIWVGAKMELTVETLCASYTAPASAGEPIKLNTESKSKLDNTTVVLGGQWMTLKDGDGKELVTKPLGPTKFTRDGGSIPQDYKSDALKAYCTGLGAFK